MDENDVPPWLLKAAQETDAMVRKVMPLMQAAQETVDYARAALASAGLSPTARRDLDLALAMEAGMREFLTAARAHRTASDSFAGIISGTGIVALAPMAVAGVAEVIVAADTATVTVRDDLPANVGMPLDAKTVFLAIWWVMALLLPVAILLLSPEVQTIIMDFLVTIGTALIIHWRVTDSRKH